VEPEAMASASDTNLLNVSHSIPTQKPSKTLEKRGISKNFLATSK